MKKEKMLAGQIVRQTEKLQFLLQSLVKMSRLETGILELSPADGEIAPMIRETAASLQKKAEAKNICLDCELEERVICRFDRKWTSEALGNIIDNAVKYSPEESRITIRIRKYEFYACIEVEDQGPGIAEEERAQIFGRFYRGKQMRQEEGVGIGSIWQERSWRRKKVHQGIFRRWNGKQIFHISSNKPGVCRIPRVRNIKWKCVKIDRFQKEYRKIIRV